MPENGRLTPSFLTVPARIDTFTSQDWHFRFASRHSRVGPPDYIVEPHISKRLVLVRVLEKQRESGEEILRSAVRRIGNATAIVMFGHRHQRSLSTLGNIILEEAPN